MVAEVVEYRTLDFAPGKYFSCPCGLGLLSVDSCARSYRDAMSPAGLKEGRRITCRACPLGAFHAGVPASVASSSRLLGSNICSRCHGESRRLIRGSICVSCYNREREVLIGKNAKGGKPIHGRNVGDVTVACLIDAGRVSQVRRANKVSSRLEAVMSILRVEAESVWFGWAGSSVVPLGG